MKGYRTILANGAASLPVVVDLVVFMLQDPTLPDVLPKEWMPFYTLAVIAMNFYLRSITSTTMGQKK